MLTISILELLLMIIMLPLVGAIIGYVVAGDRLRKAAGGKDPEELKAEMSDYRSRVDDHFRETANLLNAMTEQYRQVYTHMANGAADLCEDADSKPQIEQMQRRSLALAPEEESSAATTESSPETAYVAPAAASTKPESADPRAENDEAAPKG